MEREGADVGEPDGAVGRVRGVWTVVNGRRIFGRASARPLPAALPPVVLVHGLSMSGWYLTPTVRRLAPFCPVYAPDLPGFGQSENPPRVLSMSELAGALAEWMRAAGVERAVMLGHSLGCQVVAHFAARYPDMTAGVILVSPALDGDASGLRLFVRAALNFVVEPLTMVVLVSTGVWQAGPWRTWRTFRCAMSDRRETPYSQIQAATLIVRGERDPIAPQRWAERIAAMLPHSRPLCLLRGRTHALNMNAPRTLLRAILPFLREIAAQVDGPPSPLTMRVTRHDVRMDATQAHGVTRATLEAMNMG